MASRDPSPREVDRLSHYLVFPRQQWALLRGNTPLTLSEERLLSLRSLNDRLSLQEVEQIYLPLSRLFHLYVEQDRHATTATFPGHPAAQVPYVIGIAGSVAVGKSTTARLLQTLLSDWPSRPKVELVTTDGFLYPNHLLEERGLMQRKGFPESYDLRRLMSFLADIKAGVPEVSAPVYSHLTYDIVPEHMQVIRRPDILIVEGLNILQTGEGDGHCRKQHRSFVSDFFDFTIYLDAHEADIEQWYIERFLLLRETAFSDPSSYFRRYARLSVEEARATARSLWQQINGPNLRENILPTRERAHLILQKGHDHAIQQIRLRKL